MSDQRVIVLRVMRKDSPEETVTVTMAPFILGRVGAHLDLKDGSVSRRHCEIMKVEGGWAVRDLDSSNGTFVNDERVSQSAIGDGDVLKLGQTEICFTLQEAAKEVVLEADSGKKIANLVDDTALWNIVELSVGAADEKQWLRSYLETAMKRFEAFRGFVVEYDPGSGVARPVASVSGDAEDGIDHDQKAFSRSIVDDVIQEKRAVVTSNANADPRFSDAQSIDQYNIRAVVCAPTRWQGEVNGAVYLERRQGGEPYTEESAQALQDLADLLGVAIMAWRGHLMERREEWEREWLAKTFSSERVERIIKQGGMSAVRRQVREGCVVGVCLSKTQELIQARHEEAWRLVSQLFAQIYEILQRHGGALIGGPCAMFEATGEKDEEYSIIGVRAGIEIQRIARTMLKRLGREQQIGIGVGVGVATGTMLSGYFGAGHRVDYQGVGEATTCAKGLSFYAHDGEILIDQTTYNKVRLFVNTHRVAPVSLPGLEQQVHIHRVASY